MNLEKRKEHNKEYYLKNKDILSKKAKEYYFKNKEHILARVKTWSLSNKNKKRENQLKRKYNLTLDQYNKMLSDQNNSCKVCNTHESELTRKLNVDHCHATSKVRGLLCDSCNTSLGKLKEDTKIMQKLIEYVKEHNE